MSAEELTFEEISDGVFRVKVADEDSDIIIITPQPPQPEQGDSEESDEMPDNIENESDEGQDDEGQDDEGQDDEGQDGEGQDDEGKDGEGQDDEGQDGEGQDEESQDEEGQDGEGQDGESQESESQDGEGQGTQSQEGANTDEGVDSGGSFAEFDDDDEFGDDDNFTEQDLMDALSEIQKDVEAEKKRLEKADEGLESDEKAVAEALSTTVEGMKSAFGNQRIAKIALGSTQVFNVNNEARVTAALKSIFSK